MDQSERSAALMSLLGCTDASANALGQTMQFHTFPAKTVLCHQGDQIEDLWLILSGSLQLQTLSIEGQATVISTFGPGELVGAFPQENEQGFDILTSERAEALQIGARALTAIMERHPDLGPGLAAIFAGQLDRVLDRLSARVSLTANGRFYRELLRHAGNREIISPPPVISAIALLAQTTRETGSRAVSALERRGIVSRDPQQLTIVSRRMLEDLIV